MRKRQVTVNVRVLEVRLGDTQVSAGGVSFLGGNPIIAGTGSQSIGIGFDSSTAISLPTSFLSTLTASITSGNAKVLTDPNLTVQEGKQLQLHLPMMLF